MTTPSPRKFPVDASSQLLVKKPLYSYEFQDVKISPTSLQILPHPKRTRSATSDIENSLSPKPIIPDNTSRKPSKDRRRSRSCGRPFSPVNSPTSPDFRIRAIPQPQGCSIV